MRTLTDARGVEIEPGDTVIYGFGVGRSVAMAEGVVVGDTAHRRTAVSLTASGRVRVRIIRRSYASGSKPVVDIAPDRLVVLKAAAFGDDGYALLPPSPLPTQIETNRQRIENLIEVWTSNLRATEVTDSWKMHHPGESLTDYHVWCATQLRNLRQELKELEDAV